MLQTRTTFNCRRQEDREWQKELTRAQSMIETPPVSLVWLFSGSRLSKPVLASGEGDDETSDKQPLSTQPLQVGGREQAGVPQSGRRRSQACDSGRSFLESCIKAVLTYRPRAEPAQLTLGKMRHSAEVRVRPVCVRKRRF